MALITGTKLGPYEIQSPLWLPFGARISPDGKRIAYTLDERNSGKAAIWIHDIASLNGRDTFFRPVSGSRS